MKSHGDVLFPLGTRSSIELSPQRLCHIPICGASIQRNYISCPLDLQLIVRFAVVCFSLTPTHLAESLGFTLNISTFKDQRNYKK